MSETECRWKWTKPDKPGLWIFGLRGDEPSVIVHSPYYFESAAVAESRGLGWWAYICHKPEPLPPKKKAVQTLWMVPQTWYVGGTASTALHSANWFGPDDTIPPGAIETVQKREVEQ